MSEGFDFISDIITMPQPGKYAQVTEAGLGTTYRWQGYGSGGAFDVPLGEGRFYGTALESQESGPDWGSQIRWWGSLFDKRTAMDALTTPFDAAPNIASEQDPRSLVASFAVVFPSQIEAFLGGVLADSPDETGPGVDLVANKVLRRRWTDPAATWSLPAGTALDPALGYNMRNYLQTVAFARLAAPLRGVLVDSMRIVVLGSADDFTTTLPTVSYSDPISGKTYRALSRIRSGKEVGIGARMLLHATALSAAAQDVSLPLADRANAAAEVAAYVREIELLRGEAMIFDHLGK